MIPATGEKPDGTPVVMLGLSAENLVRLAADEPILVHLAELDPRLPKVDVVLFAGTTDQQIIETLARAAPAAWRLDRLGEAGG